jgi:hypothetical protein
MSTDSSTKCNNCGSSRYPTHNCRFKGVGREQFCSNCVDYGHLVADCYSDGSGAVNRRPSGWVPRNKVSRLTAHLAEVNQIPYQSSTSSLFDSFSAQKSRLEPIREQLTNEIAKNRQAHQIIALQEQRLFQDSEAALVVSANINPPAFRPSNFVLFICGTGATCHLVNDAILLSNVKDHVQMIRTAAEDHPQRSTLSGAVQGYISTGSDWNAVELCNVLYVPGLAANFFAIRQFKGQNVAILMVVSDDDVVLHKNDIPFARGSIGPSGLHSFQFMIPATICSEVALTAQAHSIDLDDLHRSASHIGVATLKHAVSSGRVIGVSIRYNSSESRCSQCVSGKSVSSSHYSRPHHCTSVGDLIHADILFFDRPSIHRNIMTLIFLSRYSNFCWFFPLKCKDGLVILRCWSEVLSFVRTQNGKHVKSLRTGHGTEFVNAVMKQWNSERGIMHRITVSYEHEMNGFAERFNRTIEDAVRTFKLLLDAALPQ